MAGLWVAVGVVCVLAGVACVLAPERVLAIERRAPRWMQNWSGARRLWRNHEHARMRFAALGFAVVSAGFFLLAFGIH